MYNILIHAHSGFRWLLLVLLILAIIKHFSKWSGKQDLTAGDMKFSLYALIMSHIQLILGLILYFISPNVKIAAASMSDSLLRFFTIEHSLGMIIAIMILTLGYTRMKKAISTPQGHRIGGLYFLIGLLIILLSIPWPFRGLGQGWF